VVIVLGLSLLATGMILVGLLNVSWVSFYAAAVIIGLGLGMLLGAPLRYVVLNEAPATARAASQGVLSLFTSSGQLIGGALVGAVAASLGGGVTGYQSAYLAVGVVALMLILLALNLKSRTAEVETVRRNEAARGTDHATGMTAEIKPA
jgi:MFS family permease